MKTMRKAVVVSLVVLGALLLGGCPGLFSPSLEGTWEQIAELIVPSGPDTYGAFTNTTAEFGPGTYSFSYTILDPYPDGTPVTSSHSGTISPAEPVQGDSITFTCTASSGGYAPSIDDEFPGELTYLGRESMVLKIQTGAEFMFPWTFERVD